MAEARFGRDYSGNPAANYEKFFVPAIGAPVAEDLMRFAALRPGERVLDVACGTGVVARLAAAQVGDRGRVTGLDVSPEMLAVARTATPPGVSIDWHEASADAMDLPDASFDVALCQMGLPFMPDREGALGEMRRVLAEGGRLLVNMPGPTPRPFVTMGEALGRYIGAEAVGFVHAIFSLHDTAAVEALVRDAGFGDVSVRADTKTLHLPAPAAFLWQYVLSTPLAGAVAHVDDDHRAMLERDIVAAWQPFAADGGMVMPVRMVTATARA